MPESTTPDTLNYLLLGLGAVFVIMGGLIGSMILRFRSLQKDIDVINRLKEDDQV
jgi:hypothetical protein